MHKDIPLDYKMCHGKPLATYRGRFAPSPSGPLHLGSLVTAVGSYLDAKFNHGQWLVRIEDLDLPRVVPGASHEILKVLENLGMEWDSEVIYQSQRSDIYHEALTLLRNRGMVYPCTCTRKEINESGMMGINGTIYPGTCRNNNRATNEGPCAWRVKTDSKPIKFRDVITGCISQRIDCDVGDFVLQRADSVYAYQLAVVVDDAEQEISHVVRGTDLQDSTPRQIYLQQLLGYPVLSYMHLPLVTNASGEKLSKQTYAAPLDLSNGLAQLIIALHFLGQEPPDDLGGSSILSFWQWALENWRPEKIPGRAGLDAQHVKE